MASYRSARRPPQARYASAQIQYEQTQAQVRSRELRVATEVTNAALSVESGVKRLEAARLTRELAEKQLEAEASKFEVGMSTTIRSSSSSATLPTRATASCRAILDFSVRWWNSSGVQSVGAPPRASLRSDNRNACAKSSSFLPLSLWRQPASITTSAAVRPRPRPRLLRGSRSRRRCTRGRAPMAVMSYREPRALSEDVAGRRNLVGSATVQVVTEGGGGARSVRVRIGDTVGEGQVIATSEDNEIRQQVRRPKRRRK